VRIKVLEVNGYGKVKSVRIEPGGASLVKISGRNKQGKTSVMQSIEAALCGAKAAIDVPINFDEDFADIKLEMDDDSRLIVHRRFLASGKTELEVTSADEGLLKKPQQILDEILGTRFLNPVKFMAMKPKEQRETLLGLVDLSIDLDELEKERDRIFNTRTNAKRDLAKAKALAESCQAPVTEIPARIDASELVKDMKSVQDSISARDAARNKLATMRATVTEHKSIIAQAEAEIIALEAKLIAKREFLADRKGQLKSYAADCMPHKRLVEDLDLEDYDDQLDAIGKQMTMASDVNDERAEMLAQLTASQEAKKAYRAAKIKAEAMTDAIKDMDAEKKAALEAAKMPIDNLDVTADGLLYNNLPLTQASGAEQVEISLAIAAAINPGLRDIVITQGGNDLDKEAVLQIEKYAKKNDLTVWLERAGEEANSIVIEDGSIKTKTTKPIK